MTWTNITTTTTISASRAVTLPARLRSEPIKILALHPGTGIGGTLTIWDENGASVQVTRLDANSTRYEAEFYSAVDGFNYSFAADGNGTLASPGVSVYLTSRAAPEPDVVDSSISMSGPVDASGGIRIVQAGSKGMRIPFYRLANIANDALGYTYQTIISLEQHFDAVQLVIGTLQTSGTIRSAHYCNVIADENLTDAALNALSGWAFVDWAENDGNGVRAQFASFAATTSRPRLMLSEIKTFNSVNRTDGGAGALLVVRSHLYPDNLTPTLAGNGTTDVFANVARTDGRTMKIRRMVNNGMTTFTGGADASQTPLLGVIYYSRGKVVNVVKFGDSIMQGRNSPMGDGYVRPETIRRNNVDGVAWECSDCAWSGLTTGNYHNLAMDILDNANLPVDIAIYPGESPNNIASGASEATALAAVKANKFRLQQFLDKCRSKRVIPILSAFAPVATAVNNYTACDNVRRDYNDSTIRPYASRNTLIVDTDSVLAGANVGGQVQPLAGVMEDGIHPSTAGNALISPLVRRALDKVTVA